MKTIYKIILKRICKKLVLQGPSHKEYITEYYRIMCDAARNEFTEDTVPGLHSFLKECFEKGLDFL